MTWPPSIAQVRIAQPAGRGFRVWVPVIILWPLAIVVLALLTPIFAIVAALRWQNPTCRALPMALPMFLTLLFAVRGLEVHVRSGGNEVYVSLK